MPRGVYQRRLNPKTKTREYSIWIGMRVRCDNPNNSNYKNYGGRGIKVCERWSDFAAFRSDVGDIPEGMQLDRIDNNGNYEPGNVRVVSSTENHRNAARSKRWVIDGVEYPSRTFAARVIGVGVTTIKCWCDGYTGNNGVKYPSRPGCHSFSVY